MPRQTTLTPARRRAPQQLDLFAGALRTKIGGMPGMVRTADGSPSSADRSDDTVDPGSCRQKLDWLDNGGRP